MLARVAMLAALALAALLPSAVARAENPTLVATVGTDDSFTIALTDPSGARVTHLAPGTYTIVVHDRSEIHNFHLRGPGVNKATSVDATGTRTWTVTLRRGTYRFLCDPHPTTMKGSFRVS